MPPWAERRSDALAGAVIGATLAYFAGHLLAGPEVACWGLLAGAALGARIGWGR